MQPLSTLFTEKSLLRTNTVTDTVRIDELERGCGGEKEKKGRRLKSTTVDRLADTLVTRFNNPDRRVYYCKVAWKLPESTILRFAEQAERSGKDPQRLFTWLCEEALES
jgi:hypothetical protein